MFCEKRCSYKFTKFTEKHSCQSLFSNKVARLRPATLLKKRLWHRSFPVNFVKFLRKPFFIEHLWRLLLKLTDLMLCLNDVPLFVKKFVTKKNKRFWFASSHCCISWFLTSIIYLNLKLLKINKQSETFCAVIWKSTCSYNLLILWWRKGLKKSFCFSEKSLICEFLITLHNLLKKSLMENFIFCAESLSNLFNMH